MHISDLEVEYVFIYLFIKAFFVSACSPLSSAHSMHRNVNVLFICFLCRQPCVTSHIHEAACLEHFNFFKEKKEDGK